RMDALNELERLYEGESQWENVVDTLHAKIANLDDLEAKVELYLRIAEIWELQVGDIDKAAGAFQSILDLDPARESAFASLVELYTNHERWQELLSAYLERSEVITDQQPRLELLLKGAKIAEENMQQPETAFAVLIQYAVPQNWKDETLASEVQRLAELTNNWDTLVGTYEEMIENEVNPADNLALHNTVARWYFHHLNNNEASWQHFQYVLNEDPNNLPALAAMTEIFWRLGNWEELVSYLNRRLELTTITDDRVSLFMELAKVLEEKLNDPDQAIVCYTQAFKLNEQRLDVMKELARIYESRGQWNELVDILEREFPVLEEDEEKIAVRNKIGLVWESQLGDYEKAVEAYVSVVQLDETNRIALTALERLNAALERWTDLLKIYEYQLAAFVEPEEQIAIYSKVSQVYETSLNDLDNAITSMVQVTLIDPSNIPAIMELERLYERAERWQDLIDIINVHINTLSNVNDHIELYRKLGTVYRDKMGDTYHAVESFQYLIGIDPSDKPAYYALADLYEASEDYIGAIDYLNHVINCLTDTSEAIQVHFRIGQLYDKHLQDDVAAEERYKICLDIDAGYMPAIDALSDMYERHEDWSNQVRILKQKVEFTRELDQKAEINCALGNVSLNKIGDPINAYAYYNEALSLQPDCVSAAWPLAEKHLVDKSWARALRLFEIVIKGVEFDGSNNASLYELNYKAGLCCQNLEQHQRALEFYRASYELNQDYAPTLLGMGEELLEANEYERAYNMFQSLLERFSGELTPEQVIQIYYDSAVAKKATNDLALARQLLERILEADGTQTKSLELIIDVCTEMGAWDAVVYYMSIHMDRQVDKDIKFTELMKIARIYADKIGDTERQIQTYYQALEIDPNSRIVLNDLLNIYSATGQWENAISILDRICENENDPQKIARLFYTIAVIYRDELNIDDLAIEYFNRTLDTDINQLQAFEAIDRILTASRDWETLEVNYTNMIKRIKTLPEFTDTLRQLWYGLGEIYRTRLNEWDKAIIAFQEASKLKPSELKYHHILSELYIRMPDHGRDAIEEIRTIIDLQGASVTEEQERKNYRSLFYLYYQLGDLDKAWCISDITVAKGFAMQDEVDHHDSADDMLAAQLPRLNQDDVRNYIYHPSLSMDLTRLFNYILQAIRRVFCHKDKDEGIKKSRALKPNNDSAFWRIYSNVVQSLGITNAPAVYDCEILSSGMRIANVDFQAFKIANDMKVGRAMDELRFIISRNLFLYQNFYMAGIDLGASALRALFMASAAYCNNMKPIDKAQQLIQESLRDAPKAIQQDIRRTIENIAHQDQKNVNISEWLRSVDLTCDRVGLLYSANFGMAATLIKRDDLKISKLTADERIAELTKFAMSDEYSRLRGRLNIKAYDDSEDVPQQ
ncbi:MAG: tetratricopeptide repeat protein, partial [Proteobacteria bacterium]|nr:tetratricopeptide repeat protein [Pseudomonadota bacterium]